MGGVCVMYMCVRVTHTCVILVVHAVIQLKVGKHSGEEQHTTALRSGMGPGTPVGEVPTQRHSQAADTSTDCGAP